MKAKHNRRLPSLLAAAVLFCLLAARPLPANAEITFRAWPYMNPSDNPFPSTAQVNLIWEVIRTLANNPALSNHPIRRYLNSSSLKATIVFDNPLLPEGTAASNKGNVFVRSDADRAYYLENLVHEFIHVDMIDKYVQKTNYVFLYPEDFAFQGIMEEAFANTMDIWLRMVYPNELNSNFQVRNWEQQLTKGLMGDALRNEFRTNNPSYSDERIRNMVIEWIFNYQMTSANYYSLIQIPEFMYNYRGMNTFLIPEYAAYRQRGDALLRYQWYYLVSVMPFSLPLYMTYDYFRGRFMQDAADWANYAIDPQDTILYWVNYDYEAAARARIAAQKPEDVRYNYLPREDEVRLNQVFLELDPSFTPVNTARSLQRQIQETFDLQRQLQQTTGTQGNR